MKTIKRNIKVCEDCGTEILIGNRHRANGCNGFAVVKKVKIQITTSK